MKENGMYMGKSELYSKIRENGGVWTDSKIRPIVCLIQSTEHASIYWAIPVGNYDHRTPEAKQRLGKFMEFKEHDIRSCYYHLGRTTVKSIFFI